MTVRHRDGIYFDCDELLETRATERGYRAQPLKRDQRTLGVFC